MENASFPVNYVADSYEIIQGLVRYQDDTIDLEYRKPRWLGLRKAHVETKTVRLGDIRSLELREGMFNWKLTLRAASMTTLDGVPGADHAELALSIARKDQELARAVLNQINTALLERKIAR